MQAHSCQLREIENKCCGLTCGGGTGGVNLTRQNDCKKMVSHFFNWSTRVNRMCSTEQQNIYANYIKWVTGYSSRIFMNKFQFAKAEVIS
jgi:hypothetical protein